MTDPQYKRQVRRVRKLVEKWQQLLGLVGWSINVAFVERIETDGLDPDGRWIVPASCSVMWEYLNVNIFITNIFLLKSTDEELEETILHELLHARVAEMHDVDETEAGQRHEERVVTHLTISHINTFEAGFTAGYKHAQKEARKAGSP